jgi:cell division protein FtsB
MEREAETQAELQQLREENKRLREIIAQFIQRQIADMVEPGERSANSQGVD